MSLQAAGFYLTLCTSQARETVIPKREVRIVSAFQFELVFSFAGPPNFVLAYYIQV